MSANKGLFAKYSNRVFIETGSMGGDGIQQALDEGFELAYSIELDPHWFNHCKNRFKDKPVHMILGDSGKLLSSLLSIIDEPVTFWLDAHNGSLDSRLREELTDIKNHKVKTHTILIDDLRDWKVKRNGFDTDMLKQWVLEINPGYKIVLENGYKKEDILAARI
jgi:hypothetical protein